MASFKAGRLGEDIKRELTDIIRGLKDPRIAEFLTIVRVDLSNDLSHCKIYVSSFEGIEKVYNTNVYSLLCEISSILYN